MSSNRKRKIIGVAVISGVILVSVASVGAVKLVNEANATEVNKYVTAQASSAKESNSYAEEKNYSDGTFSYRIMNNNAIAITQINLEKISDDNGYLIIPTEIEDRPVRRLGTDDTPIKFTVSESTSKSYKIIVPRKVTSIYMNDKEKTSISTYFLSTNINSTNIKQIESTGSYEDNYEENQIYGIRGTGLEKLNNYAGDIYNYSIVNEDTNDYGHGYGKGYKVTGLISALKSKKIDIRIPEFIKDNSEVIHPVISVEGDYNEISNIIFPTTLNKISGSYSGINKFYVLGKKTNIDGSITLNQKGNSSYYGFENSGMQSYCASNSSISMSKLAIENDLEIKNADSLKVGVPLTTKYLEIYAGIYEESTDISKPFVATEQILDSGNIQIKTASGKDAFSTAGSNMVVVNYCGKQSSVSVNVSNLLLKYNLQPDEEIFDGTQNKTISYNEAVGELKIPTKENKLFGGWVTYKNVPITSQTRATTDKDIDCFATWQEGNVYEVTLLEGQGVTAPGTDKIYYCYRNVNNNAYYLNKTVNNNGAEEMEDMLGTNGSGYSKIVAPAKQNENFKGYFTAATGGTKIIDENGYMTENAQSISQDTTLYAQWTKNEEENVQTITLNDMGGTTGYLFVNGDGNVYSDGSCTNSVTLITVPTKNEYEFIGVFRGNTKIIDENGEIYTATLKGMYDANKSDYETTAKWIRKVTFDKNGGTGGTDKLYLSGSTIYSDIALTNKVSSITKPTREGCTFKGYYTTYNNTEVTIINEDGTVNTNNINIYTSTSASTALIAKWIKNEDENVAVTGIEVTPTSSEIKVGGTATITATVKPNNATNKNVTWSSSNTAVATVSNGVVTGKSEGTATITATTEDGNYTAEATITVKKDIEDTEGPIISSVKGEKDSDGKYKVIIKVTDESGIEKILVNGTEITTKDDEGNFYFIPTQNGEYKIEAFDTVENSTEYTYTEKNIITETKIIPDKDSEGNNIIYIETITNKEVDKVIVNGTEITEKDDEGRFCFKPSGNGTYTIEVTYKDGTTERKTYEETRFSENGGNNSGNNNNGGNNGNSGNSGNSGNGTIGNNNNGSDNTTGKTGDTITTSTALTELPKTGTTMGALFAAIASGISAIFAWFKQKRKK